MAKNASAKTFTLGLDSDGWYRSLPPLDTSPPTLSNTFTATATGPNNITVSWGAATDSQSGVAGYVVFYRKVGDATYTSTSSSLATTAQLSGLLPSTSHQIYYTATDVAGNVATSATTNATTQAATGAVTMTALHYDDFNGAATDASKVGSDGKRWSISDDFNSGQDTTFAPSTNHSRYNTGSGTQRSARVQLTMHNGATWYSIAGGTQAPHRNELTARPWATTGWDGRTRLGREYWLGFSIWLPAAGDSFGDPEWVPGSSLDRHFEILQQWHDSPDAGDISRNPPLNLKINNPNGAGGARSTGHWVVQTLYQTAANGTLSYNGNVSIDCGAIVTGAWTDIVMRYLPHYTSAGILQVWINDVLVVSRIGLPNAFNDTFGPYPKIGLYCGQAQGAPSGTPPADWPAKRVWYYDEWALYEAVGNPAAAVDTSNTAYQTVKPRGVRASGV
jgi:hypothetical protein